MRRSAPQQIKLHLGVRVKRAGDRMNLLPLKPPFDPEIFARGHGKRHRHTRLGDARIKQITVAFGDCRAARLKFARARYGLQEIPAGPKPLNAEFPIGIEFDSIRVLREDDLLCALNPDIESRDRVSRVPVCRSPEMEASRLSCTSRTKTSPRENGSVSRNWRTPASRQSDCPCQPGPRRTRSCHRSRTFPCKREGEIQKAWRQRPRSADALTNPSHEE